MKLSKLNDKIFPIPQYSNIPETKLSDSKYDYYIYKWYILIQSIVKGLPKNSFVLKNMAQYNLEPRNGITYLDRPAFNHTNFDLPEIKEIENNQEYAEAVKLAKAEADKVDTETEDFPGKDVEIVTLGTGSSIPAKYRNGKYYFVYIFTSIL